MSSPASAGTPICTGFARRTRRSPSQRQARLNRFLLCGLRAPVRTRLLPAVAEKFQTLWDCARISTGSLETRFRTEDAELTEVEMCVHAL